MDDKKNRFPQIYNGYEDRLLEMMFNETDLWEKAIDTGLDKKMRLEILQQLTDPEERSELKAAIASHSYKVKPPHEAKIPKDDGTMRTVYVNEPKDRIMLAVINSLLFQLCPDMVHPQCLSYQTGIGCGKIDKKVVADLEKVPLGETLGFKADLSKYFDSVRIEYIDKAFDQVEERLGKSAVMDMVREYYHDDTLLDIDKNEIHKFTSLRQGCAIAAFLADAVLYHIDEAMHSKGIVYYRYSDDILLIGKGAEKAYIEMNAMLGEMGLPLNPKKVETLDRNKWFTFLGFSIKGTSLTLSKKRVKNLMKEIEARTLKAKMKNPRLKPETALRSLYLYLYDNSITKYAYMDGILPVINSKKDMVMLDGFIMDCVRAVGSNKLRIGGLGYNKSGKDGVITRGKGRNVAANKNKMQEVKGYRPISLMRSLYVNDREAYDAMVCDMLLDKK